MSALIVLGVETSGRRPSVALLRGDEMVAQRFVPLEGSRRSSALIEEVDAAFRDAAISPQQLQLVAVSIGPGSFTGLRIGVTFAKTLAYGVGCPVVGVNTLQAVAESVASDLVERVETLHVVSDAQRGEVFYQPFQRAHRGLKTGEPSQPTATWTSAAMREILTPALLASRLQAGDCVVGPAIEKHHAEFMSANVDLNLCTCEPDAASVARLGRYCRDQCQSDAWSLLPDYGRLSSAEEKRGDQLRV